MLRVRLLGTPSIKIEGRPSPLSGHKPWGLLCYLLLEERGPTRREMAERLWPQADDPLRAARWALLQVRRAVAPAEIVEERGRLALRVSGEVDLDVRSIIDGTASPDSVESLAAASSSKARRSATRRPSTPGRACSGTASGAAVGDTLRCRPCSSRETTRTEPCASWSGPSWPIRSPTRCTSSPSTST